MKLLPTRYEWLDKLEGLPRTIVEARKLYGTLEVQGDGNSPIILGWAKEIKAKGISTEYGSDSIPWCGLFVAIVILRRVESGYLEVVKDYLWARNWLNFGEKVSKACLGDVLVFSRLKGGHVGFYVGEDDTHVHVLGGNQTDAVTITRIAKGRLLGIRRPRYKNKPESVKPYHLSAIGPISKNEA